MNVRKLFTAVGSGITSFLLVTVLVIELLNFEFSALIGLPVGLLAGLVVLVGLWLSFGRLSSGVRRAATGYAAFGAAVLVLLGLRYSNVGRGILSVDVIVGVGVAAAVMAYVVLLARDRDLL